jgi:hypothetical protein
VNKTLFLIFNHRFTAAQEADASHSLGIDRVIYPPAVVAKLWSHVPPEVPEILNYLRPVRDWLAANAIPGDYILIQGDFGACYILVSFAIEHGFIPIYSTTLREAIEEQQTDGTVRLVHHFDHQIFRRYGV